MCSGSARSLSPAAAAVGPCVAGASPAAGGLPASTASIALEALVPMLHVSVPPPVLVIVTVRVAVPAGASVREWLLGVTEIAGDNCTSKTLLFPVTLPAVAVSRTLVRGVWQVTVVAVEYP